MIVLDDLADVKRGLPEVARFVDSLFVKARHWGVSIVLSTQKLKLPLISPTVRVNITAMFVWRLRNSSDLTDGFLHEMQALVDKKKLEEAYHQAISIPYNFLYLNLLATDIDHMFYSGFTERFVCARNSRRMHLGPGTGPGCAAASCFVVRVKVGGGWGVGRGWEVPDLEKHGGS